MSVKNILIPLDGSTHAEQAVPVGLSVARSLGGQVELIGVEDLNPLVESWITGADHYRKWLVTYFERLTVAIRAVSNVPVVSTMAAGRVDEVLVAHAEQNQADLVVMATHGRGPLGRAWLGSVADRLVRHITKPVLLVRPVANSEVEFTDTHRFERILIPLDGSDLAEVSLEWAKTIGKGDGAAYILVRAVPQPWSSPAELYPDTTVMEKLYHKSVENSEQYLSVVAAPLRDAGLTVQTDVRERVSAARGVLDSAVQNNVDLVVIATHGHGGLRRLALGSVADKVVRGASVPVLLIRP